MMTTEKITLRKFALRITPSLNSKLVIPPRKSTMGFPQKNPASSVMKWIRGVCLPFEACRKTRLENPSR